MSTWIITKQWGTKYMDQVKYGHTIRSLGLLSIYKCNGKGLYKMNILDAHFKQ